MLQDAATRSGTRLLGMASVTCREWAIQMATTILLRWIVAVGPIGINETGAVAVGAVPGTFI